MIYYLIIPLVCLWYFLKTAFIAGYKGNKLIGSSVHNLLLFAFTAILSLLFSGFRFEISNRAIALAFISGILIYCIPLIFRSAKKIDGSPLINVFATVGSVFLPVLFIGFSYRVSPLQYLVPILVTVSLVIIEYKNFFPAPKSIFYYLLCLAMTFTSGVCLSLVTAIHSPNTILTAFIAFSVATVLEFFALIRMTRGKIIPAIKDLQTGKSLKYIISAIVSGAAANVLFFRSDVIHMILPTRPNILALTVAALIIYYILFKIRKKSIKHYIALALCILAFFIFMIK